MEEEKWKINQITDPQVLQDHFHIQPLQNYGTIFHPENFNSPKSAFLQYFDTEICKYLVDNSNKYFKAKHSNQTTEFSDNTIPGHYNRIGAITEKDIFDYISIKIVMGLVSIPDKKDYWKKSPIFHNVAISSIMSKIHFQTIESALHACDELEIPENSKNKILELMILLNNAYQKSYIPKQNITIDESMIPFKGRSKMKFYIPVKPVK